MIRRCLFATAAGLLLVPAAAFAQSEADQEACTPDVFRLCQDYIPNEGPIVACLKAKGAQLSTACHAVMFRPDPASVAPAAEAGTVVVVPRHHHKRRHHRTAQP